MSFAKRLVHVRTEPEPEDQDWVTASAELIKISSATSEREINWPRASKIYDMCVRQNVIGTKTGASVKEWSTAAGRVTFGIGNALHYWFQNNPDLFGNKRRGWWRCLACRRVVGFGGPPAKRCRFCNAHPEAIVYYEHGIALKGNPVYFTGHVDMFLYHNGMLRAAEMKSMDGDKWEKLAAPIAAHEFQLQSYMWSLPMDKRFPIPIDPRVGYIAYITKKHAAGKLPVKIYPVKRSETIIERILHRLREYKDGIETYPKNIPAPHDECTRSGFNCYRSKSCPVRGVCVGMLER